MRRQLFPVSLVTREGRIKNNRHIVLLISAVFLEDMDEAVARLREIAPAHIRFTRGMEKIIAVDDVMFPFLRHCLSLSPYIAGGALHTSAAPPPRKH